jgi:hypothetical protein
MNLKFVADGLPFPEVPITSADDAGGRIERVDHETGSRPL